MLLKYRDCVNLLFIIAKYLGLETRDISLSASRHGHSVIDGKRDRVCVREMSQPALPPEVLPALNITILVGSGGDNFLAHKRDMLIYIRNSVDLQRPFNLNFAEGKIRKMGLGRRLGQ